MAKILYAWELGADLGHLQAFLSLAMALRAQGHEVILAAKDLSRYHSLPGAQAFEAIQAPLWPAPVKGLPEPQVCYADILQRHGYLDHQGLLGIVKAWRSLYGMIDPALLIADHAPTALLAARGLPFPRITYGSGFFSPPRTTPMPSMRPWLKLPPDRIEDSETAVLRIINRVLADIGAEPMPALADLFDVDESFLLTPRELDHYPRHGTAHYLRPPLSVQGGATPEWAPAPGKKIFAYLKTNHPMIDELLQQLRESAFNVLVYIPGLSEERCRALQSANMRFSPYPVDMHYATQHAGALICHAGIGTILHGLLSGLPILLLPINLEPASAPVFPLPPMRASRISARSLMISSITRVTPARPGISPTNTAPPARRRIWRQWSKAAKYCLKKAGFGLPAS
jgi:UDP:flavonoid glycosyltransferase YjiC (YdhE family)